jgi:hypothetical protein
VTAVTSWHANQVRSWPRLHRQNPQSPRSLTAARRIRNLHAPFEIRSVLPHPASSFRWSSSLATTRMTIRNTPTATKNHVGE